MARVKELVPVPVMAKGMVLAPAMGMVKGLVLAPALSTMIPATMLAV